MEANLWRTKDRKAYIITGPTSGIGRRSAFELAKHGTVVLVGRDQAKLDEVRKIIERRSGRCAVPVACDLSDIISVRRAAAEIVALNLPIAGLLNNAGMRQERPTRSAQGWDMTFATNHLGPFVLTEALVPHLPDGANVVFVCSAVEDPERKPAKAVGFRGSRYISAEASARGEWQPGGSKLAGADAYATSKQCNLATVMVFARETPRLRFNAVEPGFIPNTGLGRGSGVFLHVLLNYILPLLAPFMKYWSNPKRAARVATRVLLNKSGKTGIYYDDGGHPMQGSALVRDPKFTSRVVAETRALLSTIQAASAEAQFESRPVSSKQPQPQKENISMQMTGNTILITGGGTGIGLALAKRFVARGNHVIICGRRAEPLAAAKSEVPGLDTIQCDVSTEANRIALAKEVIAKFPSLNVLVNNAGIGSRHAPIPQPQDWASHHQELAINLEAPMHLSMLLAPHLAKSPFGAIVNVSSGLGIVPLAAAQTYSLSKAALHSFSLTLRYQLKTTSLNVVEIIPPSVNSGAPGTQNGVDLDVFADSIFERLENGESEIGYGTSEERRLASRPERDAYFELLNPPMKI
jgi:short-subunit dehydrogenase involved in D-alanine esterification of teichoic acids